MNFVNTYHILLFAKKKETDKVDQGCLHKAFINISTKLQFKRERFYLENAEKSILDKKTKDGLTNMTFMLYLSKF